MLLLCTSVRYVVSQDVWALLFFFLTAIFLGFILLIKFLLSLFSSSNNITSVGRDVGNSYRVETLCFYFAVVNWNRWTLIRSLLHNGYQKCGPGGVVWGVGVGMEKGIRVVVVGGC